MPDFKTPPAVWVYDNELEMMTEISADVYDYWKFTRSLRSTGSFVFYINKNRPKAEYLLDPDAFLLAYYDGQAVHAGIIESVECTLSAEEGASGEMLRVTGRSGGMFAKRIAAANTLTGDGYDTFVGTAESAIRHYVDVNCITPLGTDGTSATARAVPFLTLESEDQERGDSITYSARFETLLEILETISYSGGIGWDVTLGRDEQELILSIIEGADHGTGSATQVTLSPEINTVHGIQYTRDETPVRTLIYVGGQGEAEERTVEEVYISSAEPEGFARLESFLDARQCSTSAGLQTKGQSELAQYQNIATIEIILNSNSQLFEYQVDYNLGDIVTVVYPGIATIDARIITVEDETTAGSRGAVRQLTATIGTEPGDIRRIVRDNSRNKPEQRK